MKQLGSMPRDTLSLPIRSLSANLRTQRLLSGILAHSPLFCQATPQHLAELVRCAHAQYVYRGEPIYHRGDSLHALFVVGFGLVKLSLRPGTGVEKVYRLVRAGETFGESSVFLRRCSLADAVALVDTMLVVIPSTVLNSLLERDASFTWSLVADLSQRVETLVADLEARSLYTALQRLAAYLNALASPGEPEARTTVHLAAARTVIASMLGVTKETLSRLLHELAAQGLISVAKRDITLLDRSRLNALAHAE